MANPPVILRPSAPDLGRPPRAVWGLLAGGLASALLANVADGGLAWKAVSYVATASAAGGIAHWAEEWSFFRRARSHAVMRGLAGLVEAFLVFVAGILVAAAVGLALEATALRGALPSALGFAGLWFAMARLGSLLVLALDVIASALVKDFRGRVTVAIFGLVASLSVLGATTGSAVALGVSVAASRGELIQSAGDGAQAQVEFGSSKDHTATRELKKGEERIDAKDLNAVADLNQLFLVIIAFLGAPALLSACGKLAFAVMERLGPLSGGFERVARGELAVAVEEGGSDDFVRLARQFNAMTRALGDARRLEQTFGAYLSRQLLERIQARHGDGQLEAEQRAASVLFADIRGFTAMSEKLAPAAVLDLLNRYFERVIEVIDRHEGFLNKFIGDAVVVVFNGPVDQPDHAARAAACALDIQQKVAELNTAGAFPEIGALKVGIGVASGPVVAGNLGSARQMEYTVIGDTVNLASRLTGQAGAGEVWVSEATAEALGPGFARTAVGPIKVKGKESPVTPYRIERAAKADVKAVG